MTKIIDGFKFTENVLTVVLISLFFTGCFDRVDILTQQDSQNKGYIRVQSHDIKLDIPDELIYKGYETGNDRITKINNTESYTLASVAVMDESRIYIPNASAETIYVFDYNGKIAREIHRSPIHTNANYAKHKTGAYADLNPSSNKICTMLIDDNNLYIVLYVDRTYGITLEKDVYYQVIDKHTGDAYPAIRHSISAPVDMFMLDGYLYELGPPESGYGWGDTYKALDPLTLHPTEGEDISFANFLNEIDNSWRQIVNFETDGTYFFTQVGNYSDIHAIDIQGNRVEELDIEYITLPDGTLGVPILIKPHGIDGRMYMTFHMYKNTNPMADIGLLCYKKGD